MRGLILSTLILAGTVLFAQRYSIGAATGFGNKIETMGYQIRGYYNIDHKTCFGPEVMFFPKTTHQTDGLAEEVSLREFNFNGHHHFAFGNKLGFYPLTGVSWGWEQIDETVHEAFGINVGAGIHFSDHDWTIFAEYVHLTGDLSEQTALIGIFFTPKSERHE